MWSYGTSELEGTREGTPSCLPLTRTGTHEQHISFNSFSLPQATTTASAPEQHTCAFHAPSKPSKGLFSVPGTLNPQSPQLLQQPCMVCIFTFILQLWKLRRLSHWSKATQLINGIPPDLSESEAPIIFFLFKKELGLYFASLSSSPCSSFRGILLLWTELCHSKFVC